MQWLLDVAKRAGAVEREPIFAVAPPSALKDAIDATYSSEQVFDELLGNVDFQELLVGHHDIVH